jgi:lipopolysaccharide transport system ATP-binding protein
VENATVRFNMASERIDNIKEYFVKLVKRQLRFREFLALKDINLDIKRGESWGIIGRNGAGKSTLLKLICGILVPDKGTVRVDGSISPMLELGVGFDPDLTAGENIFLEGAILGRSRKFMKEHYREIVEFSELQEFMKMPIKNYSSGMQARMGFAVATVVDPEILVVDEVLAVGDAAFQRKCEQRIHEMLESDATLLFVSHDNEAVKRLCKKAVWLHKGEVVMTGDSQEVCGAYAQAAQAADITPSLRSRTEGTPAEYHRGQLP